MWYVLFFFWKPKKYPPQKKQNVLNLFIYLFCICFAFFLGIFSHLARNKNETDVSISFFIFHLFFVGVFLFIRGEMSLFIRGELSCEPDYDSLDEYFDLNSFTLYGEQVEELNKTEEEEEETPPAIHEQQFIPLPRQYQTVPVDHIPCISDLPSSSSSSFISVLIRYPGQLIHLPLSICPFLFDFVPHHHVEKTKKNNNNKTNGFMQFKCHEDLTVDSLLDVLHVLFPQLIRRHMFLSVTNLHNTDRSMKRSHIIHFPQTSIQKYIRDGFCLTLCSNKNLFHLRVLHPSTFQHHCSISFILPHTTLTSAQFNVACVTCLRTCHFNDDNNNNKYHDMKPEGIILLHRGYMHQNSFGRPQLNPRSRFTSLSIHPSSCSPLDMVYVSPQSNVPRPVYFRDPIQTTVYEHTPTKTLVTRYQLIRAILSRTNSFHHTHNATDMDLEQLVQSKDFTCPCFKDWNPVLQEVYDLHLEALNVCDHCYCMPVNFSWTCRDTSFLHLDFQHVHPYISDHIALICQCGNVLRHVIQTEHTWTEEQEQWQRGPSIFKKRKPVRIQQKQESGRKKTKKLQSVQGQEEEEEAEGKKYIQRAYAMTECQSQQLQIATTRSLLLLSSSSSSQENVLFLQQKEKEIRNQELLQRCQEVVDTFETHYLGEHETMQHIRELLPSTCHLYLSNHNLQFPGLSVLPLHTIHILSYALFIILCSKVSYFVSPFEVLHMLKHCKRHDVANLNISGLKTILTKTKCILQGKIVTGMKEEIEEDDSTCFPSSQTEASTDLYLQRLIRLVHMNCLLQTTKNNNNKKQQHVPSVTVLLTLFKTTVNDQHQLYRPIWLREGTSTHQDFRLTIHTGNRAMKTLFLRDHIQKKGHVQKKAVHFIHAMQCGTTTI